MASDFLRASIVAVNDHGFIVDDTLRLLYNTQMQTIRAADKYRFKKPKTNKETSMTPCNRCGHRDGHSSGCPNAQALTFLEQKEAEFKTARRALKQAREAERREKKERKEYKRQRALRATDKKLSRKTLRDVAKNGSDDARVEAARLLI